ncbi:MAG: leucine-rich repeat domain-containing protein, partial [Clostridia bacterium]|nr:leucine-rich repeat domain-containing protein [Clostridia bacterium]
ITSIGKFAFAQCRSLKSVVIGNNVTNIGYNAFSEYTITSITYTGDMKSWCQINGLLYLMPCWQNDRKLFIDGKEITGELTIPDNLTIIGDWSFEGCRSLTKVIIPDGVTDIGWYAFAECSSLKSVVIPDSVTNIGSWLFAECRKLTDINYCGTKAQWEAMEKGDTWNYNTNGFTVHCTDGNIEVKLNFAI